MDTQTQGLKEDPTHFNILLDLNTENIALPIDIIEQEETSTEDGVIHMDSEINQIDLKMDQKVILDPTFEGEATQRILVSGPKLEFEDQLTIQPIEKGSATITIIPNSYDWDYAKEITIDIE